MPVALSCPYLSLLEGGCLSHLQHCDASASQLGHDTIQAAGQVSLVVEVVTRTQPLVRQLTLQPGKRPETQKAHDQLC